MFTLFSHSNSDHMVRKASSLIHEPGIQNDGNARHVRMVRAGTGTLPVTVCEQAEAAGQDMAAKVRSM